MSQTFKIIKKFSKDINLLLKSSNQTQNFRRNFFGRQKVDQPRTHEVPAQTPTQVHAAPKGYFLRTTLVAAGVCI